MTVLTPASYELGVNVYTLSDLPLAASFGFQWVRVSLEMQWGTDESIPELQKFAAACNDHGLHLFQCCQGMPAALARGGVAGHYGPKNDTAAATWGTWFAQCAAIVATTGGATSCLNEPDGYGWDTTPSAGDCATLHAAALEARDRLAPHAVFITGEMAPGDSPEQLAFLEAIVKLCPSILTEDAVWWGWHPYVDPRWGADYPALWNACHRMRDLDAWTRQQGPSYRRKRIAGGEWGVANGPVGNVRALTPQKVADYVQHSYLPTFSKMVADGLRFGPMCWYALRDKQPPSDPRLDSWANYCGLVDLHGAEKPAATVFKAHAGII